MKLFGDWLAGIIITLSTMGIAYAAITTWLKNRGINTAKVTELEGKCNLLINDVTELKSQDLDQQADIIKMEKLIEKMDRDYHDLVIFLLDRE